MHRFFVSTADFQGDIVRFDAEQVHQLRKVLRFAPGQRVIVLDNTGKQYEVELAKDLSHARIIAQKWVEAEPKVSVTLFQSLLKREKFELILQKCTEIGISRFVPVVTSRCLIQDTRLKQNKIQRWQKILKEAAEQCGRGCVPELAPAVRLDEAAEQFGKLERVIVPWEEAAEGDIRSALLPQRPQQVGILIGPEGGLSPQEIKTCCENGAVVASLGKRILRTETAAIAAGVLVMDALEGAAGDE